MNEKWINGVFGDPGQTDQDGCYGCMHDYNLNNG